MLIHHRGFSVELPDDDVRVKIIETILFAGPLPPPLPVPDLPDTVPVEPPAAVETEPPRMEEPPPQVEPPPPPPAPPPIAVPAPLARFWESLRHVERQELSLLAIRPHRPWELEEQLGFDQPELMGQHSTIARRARKAAVEPPILQVGRGRDNRRFYLRDWMVPLVTALADNRARVIEDPQRKRGPQPRG